jgi:hypothetical protein
MSALEKTLREFPARNSGEVIVPEVGVTFDSVGEAYDFYNLYSWERGFRVRYGKSRLNVDRVKCMQEIVCGCSVSIFCLGTAFILLFLVSFVGTPWMSFSNWVICLVITSLSQCNPN